MRSTSLFALLLATAAPAALAQAPESAAPRSEMAPQVDLWPATPL